MKADKLTIYGSHYHCMKCGAEMTPIKRLPHQSLTGVRCLHICPRDGTIFMEKEYGTLGFFS